jgi:hypothetical protein
MARVKSDRNSKDMVNVSRNNVIHTGANHRTQR